MLGSYYPIDRSAAIQMTQLKKYMKADIPPTQNRQL